VVDGGYDSEKAIDDSTSSGVVETWLHVRFSQRKSCELDDRGCDLPIVQLQKFNKSMSQQCPCSFWSMAVEIHSERLFRQQHLINIMSSMVCSCTHPGIEATTSCSSYSSYRYVQAALETSRRAIPFHSWCDTPEYESGGSLSIVTQYVTIPSTGGDHDLSVSLSNNVQLLMDERGCSLPRKPCIVHKTPLAIGGSY
jgi:hypothetical protein